MPISWMLIDNDLILHEEMRDIVIQIHFFGNSVDAYCLACAFYSVAEVLR